MRRRWSTGRRWRLLRTPGAAVFRGGALEEASGKATFVQGDQLIITLKLIPSCRPVCPTTLTSSGPMSPDVLTEGQGPKQPSKVIKVADVVLPGQVTSVRPEPVRTCRVGLAHDFTVHYGVER